MRRLPAAIVLALLIMTLLMSTRLRPARALPPRPAAGPTFSNEIVRLFQTHCQTCHHPGDIAPFSLMDYRSASPWAASTKYMTQTRQMPPWKPVTGCAAFAGERVLTEDEIDLIAKWVDNGAPEGNPSDLPPPLNFDSGWILGKPDLVLSYPQSYTPPASGDMYRCFTIPTNLLSDQYVATIDVHPGQRDTVHHVIVFIDTTGESAGLDEQDPSPGYQCFGGPGFSDPGTLGGWAPGARPVTLPDNIGMSLPAGSRIVLQVHYHPHGTPQADKSEIGIYFNKQKPEKLLRFLPLVNTTFTIPPNEPNYKVTASFPIGLPIASHLWVVAPHMHLLGRKISVQSKLPEGTQQCLINIDDWDFNWQGLYRYQDAVPLPAGTRLSLTAYYDNSSGNWRNPNDPPRAVSWGEATTDEMCIAFLGFTIDSENLLAGQSADASWVPPLFPPPRVR
jgi:hypothetical protein